MVEEGLVGCFWALPAGLKAVADPAKMVSKRAEFERVMAATRIVVLLVVELKL